MFHLPIIHQLGLLNHRYAAFTHIFFYNFCNLSGITDMTVPVMPDPRGEVLSFTFVPVKYKYTLRRLKQTSTA